jgi:hypothetical protein
MPWRDPEEVEIEKEFWAVLDRMAEHCKSQAELEEWVKELHFQWVPPDGAELREPAEGA